MRAYIQDGLQSRDRHTLKCALQAFSVVLQSDDGEQMIKNIGAFGCTCMTASVVCLHTLERDIFELVLAKLAVPDPSVRDLK